MTRNEYIAETTAKFYITLEFDSYELAIKAAIALANELERLGVAPWDGVSALTKLQTEQQMKHQATCFCHKCGQSHAVYVECPLSKGV